jgi:hypothetical protein
MELDLNFIVESWGIKKRDQLVKLLMRRSNSKASILHVFRDLIIERDSTSILSKLFAVFARLEKTAPQVSRTRIQSVSPVHGAAPNNSVPSPSEVRASFVLDSKEIEKLQTMVRSWEDEHELNLFEELGYDNHISDQDFLDGVFSIVKKSIPADYMTTLLLEYLRHLYVHNASVCYGIIDLLLEMLVETKSFLDLQELLQYHIIPDSKYVAYHLLELQDRFPPAYQLALDMLHRLQCFEDIVDELLKKKSITQVLKVIQTQHGSGPPSSKTINYPWQNILRLAKQTNERIFYSAFKLLTSICDKIPSDCAEFADYFQKKEIPRKP